jgi:arsenate reductase
LDKVIFACVHNAGRSQMAAAFFNAIADPDRAVAVSAGTQPADRVHPVVLQAMGEVGLDLSTARPKRLTADLAADARLLITMGCGDECPYVPGLVVQDWPLPDPAGRDLDTVRAIRDQVRSRVKELVAARGWHGSDHERH